MRIFTTIFPVFGDSVRHAFFELLQPKFCFARSHTAPRVKTKKNVGLQVHGFQIKISIFSFQSHQHLFGQGFWHNLCAVSWSCCNCARMVWSVYFLSWWKFLIRGSWNFELVQLCLNTWIAECFVRQVWYALKIFDRGSWNFKLVHIFLINRMVLLGMHGLHSLSSLVMENSCSRQLEFWACPSMLGQLDSDCFVRHAWFALSVSSRGKFLARGSWNFELLELFLDIGIGLFC